MAKYRIIGPCWLDFPDGGPRMVHPFTEVRHDDGKIEQVETVIQYAGWPSAVAMEPVDDEAIETFEALLRMKSGGQLPVSPAVWREQREGEKTRANQHA